MKQPEQAEDTAERLAASEGSAHGIEQQRWVRRAIELAVDNVRSGSGGPFGAVIVREGKMIAEAANRVTAMLDPTAHAEVLAIRAACRTLGRFELAGCEIYTSCEPCPMCLAAIYWARLDAIYQGATAEDAAEAGFDDALFYEQLRREPSSRLVPCSSLLSEEARAAFAAWVKSPLRLDY